MNIHYDMIPCFQLEHPLNIEYVQDVETWFNT